MTRRKSIRNTQKKKRHLALKSIDRIKIKRYEKLMRLLAFLIVATQQRIVLVDTIVKHSPLLLVVVARLYSQVVRMPLIVQPSPPHYDRTIDSFPPEVCWSSFRTVKADLPRLMASMRIPREVKTSNRLKFTGEEVFLFMLRRFSCNNTLEDLARNEFGRDETQWSRVIAWFVQHIWDTFASLLLDNLAYWKPFFPIFAEKIRQKLFQKAEVYFPLELSGFLHSLMISVGELIVQVVVQLLQVVVGVPSFRWRSIPGG
eukprot:Lithocolla_globosa_v1_NODE_1330_length_2665_cov_3.816545.p1 type:complete len:258 gc:universal NODE_1330_length_2665_cov_3.816545:2491-1718(-)